LKGAVRIDEILPGDLEALVRFIDREAPAPPEARALGLRSVEHYHWFLFENPAQPASVPRGWVARNPEGEDPALRGFATTRPATTVRARNEVSQ